LRLYVTIKSVTFVMTFEFKDPPKGKSPHGLQNEYSSMADEIKKRPNTWALVRTGGLYTPVIFQDRTLWKVRTHQVGANPMVHELYVMYIGEA
jgi:hypothetical protein